MSHVYSNLFELTPFSNYLLDAYGVFWGGNQIGPLPGSTEMMEKLVQMGKKIGILSNSTMLATKEIEKLQKYGIQQNKHFHFLLTSGEVAHSLLQHQKLPFPTPRHTYWVFGTLHPKYPSALALFNDTPYKQVDIIDDADFIYLPVPHINGEDQTDPNVFIEELKQIKEMGINIVCANPDHYAHEGNPPRLVVRQGAVAALYEQMGGKVFYIGKPYAKVFEVALPFFGKDTAAYQVLMVGDTPETDVRGAKSMGLSSALVTHTGIMAERLRQKELKTVFEELPSKDRPDFFLEQFGFSHEF